MVHIYYGPNLKSCLLLHQLCDTLDFRQRRHRGDVYVAMFDFCQKPTDTISSCLVLSSPLKPLVGSLKSDMWQYLHVPRPHCSAVIGLLGINFETLLFPRVTACLLDRHDTARKCVSII